MQCPGLGKGKDQAPGWGEGERRPCPRAVAQPKMACYKSEGPHRCVRGLYNRAGMVVRSGKVFSGSPGVPG